MGGALAGLAGCRARAHNGADRSSSIVGEAGGGQVLESASPDATRHPASLTKLMTLYMAFEALRDRRIALDQYVPVSPLAAARAGTSARGAAAHLCAGVNPAPRVVGPPHQGAGPDPAKAHR